LTFYKAQLGIPSVTNWSGKALSFLSRDFVKLFFIGCCKCCHRLDMGKQQQTLVKRCRLPHT
jgi:hypothetical protein